MDVIVVDDEYLIREIVMESLTQDGLQVTEASSGENALQLAAEVGTPAVIVTDINLGSGMDGLALTDELHRRCPQAGIVLMTGNPGCVGGRMFKPNERFLVKPFGPAKLVSTVRDLMGRSER